MFSKMKARYLTPAKPNFHVQKGTYKRLEIIATIQYI